jgi:hypothetical protein
MNKLWDDARAGNFDFGVILQTWAQAADSYFDVLVEAARGPGVGLPPAWLYLDYRLQVDRDGKLSSVPDTLEKFVKIGRTEGQSVEIETTVFASMQGGQPLTNAYEVCAWRGSSRSEVHIKLNMQALNDAAQNKDPAGPRAGQYISFVLPKGRTAEPPLVIVMLRINPAPA